MSKLSSFKDYPLQNNENNNENQRNNMIEEKSEKILCNHCGRTAINGIRCLGICVADNEY